MRQHVFAFVVALAVWVAIALVPNGHTSHLRADETSYLAHKCEQKNDEELVVKRCKPKTGSQGPYCEGYCEKWEPVEPTYRCVGPTLALKCTEAERGIEAMYLRSGCGQNHPKCDACGKWTAVYDDPVFIPWPMCN